MGEILKKTDESIEKGIKEEITGEKIKPSKEDITKKAAEEHAAEKGYIESWHEKLRDTIKKKIGLDVPDVATNQKSEEKSEPKKGFFNKWGLKAIFDGIGAFFTGLFVKEKILKPQDKEGKNGIWESIKNYFKNLFTKKNLEEPGSEGTKSGETLPDLESIKNLQINEAMQEKINNTAFIGDSISVGYLSNTVLSETPYKLAKSGISTSQMLRSLDNPENIKKIQQSKQVFILGGVNDIANKINKPEDQIISETTQNLLAIGKKAKEINPNIKIIFATITPWDKHRNDKFPQEKVANCTNGINSKIRNFTDCKIIDIDSFYRSLDPEMQEKTYAGDKLHHSAFGHQLYAKFIAHSINQSLNSNEALFA
jgi:lysophospholipase L1-like esterase